MDDETYEAVCHAAKNNLSSKVRVLYKSSFITFFVMLAITLFIFIYNLITAFSGGFLSAIASAFYYTVTFFAIDIASEVFPALSRPAITTSSDGFSPPVTLSMAENPVYIISSFSIGLSILFPTPNL